MSKKILVVDDDPVIAILVNEYLSAYGHEIETLSSGTACIERLQQVDKLPDILILDLIMPEISGIDVLENIRKSSEQSLAELPVIMLSADNHTDTLMKDYDFDADAYVEKPFNIKEILDTIEKISAK